MKNKINTIKTKSVKTFILDLDEGRFNIIIKRESLRAIPEIIITKVPTFLEKQKVYELMEEQIVDEISL